MIDRPAQEKTMAVRTVEGNEAWRSAARSEASQWAATVDRFQSEPVRISHTPGFGLDRDARGERFAETVSVFRRLTAETRPSIQSSLGVMAGGADLLPKPAAERIPLIVTGSSRQELSWISQYADGWLTYPQATHTPEGPRQLAGKIAAWRMGIPDGSFRPHMTNEWLDLVEDPDFPRTPLQGGFVLRTGRKGLIDLLGEWRDAGVNHAALGVQYAARPPAEIIQELAEEVLPLFPSHDAPPPRFSSW